MTTTSSIRTRALALLAVGAALAVGVLPAFMPSGPTRALDASRLANGGPGMFALVFFAGLLTALTPCVYPLIPVTMSVFGARRDTSRGRSLALTLAYVTGIGVVFSALGVVAAKGGQAFGSMLGRPSVALFLAAFLVLLASSMFGAFELALPSSVNNRLSQVGGAGLGGAFLMGGASGFLAAPCTGPVLTGLLTYVASSQNVGLGALLLFTYAQGVGLPFLLIGIFALRLPKAGAWMEWVKSALGVMLLALAFTYAKDAFAPARALAAGLGQALGSTPGASIAAVLAAIAVGLGAIHLSFHGNARERAAKGAAVALLVAACILRLAALDAPPEGQLLIAWGLQKPLPPKALEWNLHFGAPDEKLEVFETALARAKSEGKPVLIDFYAEWCAACKDLDRETYVSPRVAAEGQRFFAIKVDGTNEPEAVQALYQRFGVKGLPTIAFISSEGQTLSSPRLLGFVEPDAFVAELRKVN